MRRYRLHWLAAGLVLLAILFIWQNSTSLVPPYRPSASATLTQVAKGKDSSAGLVNLLRRNIPAATLISTCVEEWIKSSTLPDPEQDAKLLLIRELARGETAARPGKHRPVEIYNKICNILKRDIRNNKQEMTK